MPISPGPSGFQAQFQQFMYFAGPVVQVLYWVGLLVIAFLAWRDFRRWVNAQLVLMKASDASKPVTSAPTPDSDERPEAGIDIEEFVE